MAFSAPINAPKPKKIQFAFLIAFVPAMVSSSLFFVFSAQAKSVNNPETTSKTPPPTQSTQVLSEKTEKESSSVNPDYTPLLNSLKNITQNKDGTQYAIALVDLNHDVTVGQFENEPTHAASVMKLLVAAKILKDIEEGKLTLSDSLGGSSIKNHLQRMINRSDNNSWDALANKVGTKNLQKFASEYNLDNIKIDGNEASANDFAKLLTAIYKGKLLNEENKNLLFSYMQKTETETFLTPGLPENTKFYHKTGKYGGGLHDAMIVDLTRNPYVIVAMTSNSRGVVRDRTPIFKQIASTTYEFFNQ